RGLRRAAETPPVDRLATAQGPRPPDEAVELPLDEHRLPRIFDCVPREVRAVERPLFALPAEALGIEDPLLGAVRDPALETRDPLAVRTDEDQRRTRQVAVGETRRRDVAREAAGRAQRGTDLRGIHETTHRQQCEGVVPRRA